MENIDDGRRPLDAMCNDIVEQYHAPLHRLMRRISAQLTAFAAASASPEARALREIFSALEEQVNGHMAKEEHLIFPALSALAAEDRTPPHLRQETFATVLYPIRLLETEHLRIESLLDRLREVAQEVEEPDSQDAAFRDCMLDLAELDRHLREHHRVENEVLFPRALEMERQVL
jgi:regulator of cell morphogenesis and NO signaling